jgi:hypothetical protein
MRMSGKFGVGALSALALLAAGAARAQSVPQVLTVPPGFVAVVAPDGRAALVPAADVPVLQMPDPFAMMRQMDAQMAAMMAAAQSQAAAPDNAAQLAALRQMPAVNGPVAGVSVMTVSDGQTSCTERVVYPANGGKVEVSATGSGCGQASLPGTTQTVTPAAAAHPDVTLAIEQTPAAPAPAPLVVADRN